MRGINVLWTKPHADFVFKEKYELLTAVLSALEWRAHNGDIIMYTDVPQAFYESGISNVWNDVVRLCEYEVNSNIFWAAGKIFAIKKLEPPFCVIDTDFIVWKKMNFSGEIAAIHTEELPGAYPEYDDFFEKTGFSRSVLPANTAFSYIGNGEFLKLYANEAIKFMQSYTGAEDFIGPMIFAEQRMFSMCAAKLKLDIEILSDMNKLFTDGDGGRFTHLWGFKQKLGSDSELKNSFTKRLLCRIERDFHEYYEITLRALKYFFKEKQENDF